MNLVSFFHFYTYCSFITHPLYIQLRNSLCMRCTIVRSMMLSGTDRLGIHWFVSLVKTVTANCRTAMRPCGDTSVQSGAWNPGSSSHSISMSWMGAFVSGFVTCRAWATLCHKVPQIPVSMYNCATGPSDWKQYPQVCNSTFAIHAPIPTLYTLLRKFHPLPLYF